jgi:hypothetical protein
VAWKETGKAFSSRESLTTNQNKSKQGVDQQE